MSQILWGATTLAHGIWRKTNWARDKISFYGDYFWPGVTRTLYIPNCNNIINTHKKYVEIFIWVELSWKAVRTAQNYHQPNWSRFCYFLSNCNLVFVYVCISLGLYSLISVWDHHNGMRHRVNCMLTRSYIIEITNWPFVVFFVKCHQNGS